MIKNKVLMQGVGIGLIIGALLVGVMDIAMLAPKKSLTPITPQKKQVSVDVQHLKVENSKLTSDLEDEKKTVQNLQYQMTDLKKNEPVWIYISDRMDAKSVGDMLVAAGVLKDTQGYRQILTNQHLSNKIQVGSFQFKQQDEVKKVIEMITKAH